MDESPEKTFWELCRDVLSDRNLAAVARATGIHRGSLAQFVVNGQLGDDKREMLSRYLFNKGWREAVAVGPISEEASTLLSDEARALWQEIGVIKDTLRRIEDHLTGGRPTHGRPRHAASVKRGGHIGSS